MSIVLVFDVCMYICACIFVAYMHKYTYFHVHMCKNTCTLLCTYVCVYVLQMCVCALHMCVCVRVSVCAHKYIHTYKHVSVEYTLRTCTYSCICTYDMLTWQVRIQVNTLHSKFLIAHQCNTHSTRNPPRPTTNICVYVYVYICRYRYTLEELDEVLFGIVDVIRFMCNNGESFQYTVIWNLGQEANIYTHLHKGSEEKKNTYAHLHGWR